MVNSSELKVTINGFNSEQWKIVMEVLLELKEINRKLKNIENLLSDIKNILH